jgi:hypothetical protein
MCGVVGLNVLSVFSAVSSIFVALIHFCVSCEDNACLYEVGYICDDWLVLLSNRRCILCLHPCMFNNCG